MGTRKTIGKKLRFEVFKRDKFTCQYCGRMSPDVILEVDHIKPVAEGGNNSILNLITSCRDCNRGKGKTRLSENTELKKQQKELAQLAERNEQMKMLIKWKEELANYELQQVEAINNYISTITEWECSECGKANIKRLISKFSFTEVYDAVEISYSQYYDGTDESWNEAFNKIGGICYNRRNHRNAWDE